MYFLIYITGLSHNFWRVRGEFSIGNTTILLTCLSVGLVVPIFGKMVGEAVGLPALMSINV